MAVVLIAGLTLASGFETAAAGPEARQRMLTVEGLVLHRDDLDGTDFTGPDDPGVNPFVLIRPSDVDPDLSGGFRVTLEQQMWGHWFQFSGFYAGQFEASGTFVGLDDGPLGTNASYDNDAHLNPGADVSTGNSDEIFALTIKHETTLAGTESSLVIRGSRIGLPEHKKILLGTRSLYLGEDLRSIAYDDSQDFLGADNDIDRVVVETHNRLFGVQIGLEGMKQVSDRVSVGGNVKGGLFANFVKRERSFSSDNMPLNRLNDSIDGTAFAQVVEVNPRIKIHVSKNAYLTFSGNLMWINGVSEAGEHYATVTDADDRNLRDDGDVLFYGGSAGIVIPLN